MTALQMDLFKSKRQRGTCANRASEFALHCAVMDTIRVSKKPGWIAFHPANGGWRTPAEAGRFKRLGVLAGTSDILLIGPPAGCLHALELKRQGEEPTDEQIAFLEDVRAAGGQAAWVDNYREAIDVLTSWGAVRVRVEA